MLCGKNAVSLVPGLGFPEDSDENPKNIWNTKENPKSTWLEKSTEDQGDFLLNIRNEERLVLQMLKLIKTTWLGVELQENKVEP